VTYKPIVRQRIGKHIPAGANACNNKTFIARQRISKHTKNNTGQLKAVFSVGLAPRLYNEKCCSELEFEDNKIRYVF
jgi:hypothetical protein